MKKRLFNIHKLIGINISLFFFISLFFGILTIFQPYINFWEDKQNHLTKVEIENINLNKCLKEAQKRVYFDETGKKMDNNFIKLQFPSKEVRANNLIQVKNRPNFYLNPQNCKRIKPKNFKISKFFDKIHTGRIFNSLIFSIIFGFMSVAVVFLCLSGLFLIIKNNYKNGKTKSIKGFLAKYHRLLLLYTLPLVLMFGITGALFNLGVYSSPIITSYLTNGKTTNVLEVNKNILVDSDLKYIKPTRKVKTLNLNDLYTKAKKEFKNVSFYEMQIYNHNDVNSRVKFIGYEPDNYFISSITNETYIILDGVNGNILDKKLADEGSFAEKTLDSIFYLHYLKTFDDIPRIIFALICMGILFGLVTAILLWFKRAKEDKFSYKFLRPLSFTILYGSFLSATVLFASVWLIPKAYLYFEINDKLYQTQEILFYLTYIFVFIYIFFQKSLLIIFKNILYISSVLLIISVVTHSMNSGFNLFQQYQSELTEIFFTNITLILVSIIFILLARRIKNYQLQA